VRSLQVTAPLASGGAQPWAIPRRDRTASRCTRPDLSRLATFRRQYRPISASIRLPCRICAGQRLGKVGSDGDRPRI